MITHFSLGSCFLGLPELAQRPWPRTRDEARRLADELNVAARRDREQRDSAHAQRLADLDWPRPQPARRPSITAEIYRRRRGESIAGPAGIDMNAIYRERNGKESH
jgi:hypothetical protein